MEDLLAPQLNFSLADLAAYWLARDVGLSAEMHTRYGATPDCTRRLAISGMELPGSSRGARAAPAL